jgi:ribonuclease HI
MKKLKIYTDGGCSPNPGPGGWSYVIIEDGKDNITEFGGDTDTTNNKMELTAITKALNSVQTPSDITIYSDSQYCVKGITSWLANWVKKDFKVIRDRKKVAILNKELWLQIWDLMHYHQVKAYHVRAHSGITYNEMADELATKGRLVSIGVDVHEELHRNIENVSDDEFDQELMNIIYNMSIPSIVSYPGVMEILREELNNEVLSNLEKKKI